MTNATTAPAGPRAEADAGWSAPGPPARPGVWGLAAFTLIAAALAVGYTLYTNHIWEDFFITFRHSRNLCEGNGLVFTPGERVHGFTSPLGTLLPALCYLATGRVSHLPALWMFRAISIVAYAAAGVVLLRTLRLDGRGRPPEGFFLGLLYLLHAPLLDYSINGQETAFMALFMAWGFLLIVRGLSGRWAALGLCWAGLMWTRPDGCVYIAALAAAALAFADAPRRTLLGTMVRAAAVCALVYLPWFAWAWWYYGSPVPHTVIAKSSLDLTPALQAKIILKETADRYFGIAAKLFQPAYARMDASWHPGLALISGVLGVFSCTYWLMPTRERSGRVASLICALLCLYYTAIPTAFAWYLPPAAILGLVAVARGVLTLGDELQHRSRFSRAFARAALAVIVAERVWFLAETAEQFRIQQAEIENGVRTRIGLWLKERVGPGERVYLEPLGYIGYFSQARMADWPGLASPEVVRIRREKKVNFVTIIPELRPEWMVLRPGEVSAVSALDDFREHYEPVATFDARPRLKQIPRIPGRTYLESDAMFTIYHRKAASSVRPAKGGSAGSHEPRRWRGRVASGRHLLPRGGIRDRPGGTEEPSAGPQLLDVSYRKSVRLDRTKLGPANPPRPYGAALDRTPGEISCDSASTASTRPGSRIARRTGPHRRSSTIGSGTASSSSCSTAPAGSQPVRDSGSASRPCA